MRPIVFLLGLGAAVVGLVVLGTKKSEAKKKAIDAALDLGLDTDSECEIHADELETFGGHRGYKIYYFDKASGDARAKELGYTSWILVPPKPEFVSDPHNRAFATDVCHFIRWNGSRWVPDDTTQNEFLAWWSSNPTGSVQQ